MDQDEALLIAIEQWHENNWADLAHDGIAMTLRPRSTGRSKNSASIEFQTADRAVSAVFWDSGESEVITAEKFGQEAPTVIGNVVESVDDVAALLNRVHLELLRAKPPAPPTPAP